MSTRLEAYGGSDSRCRKCGTKDANTDWVPPGVINEMDASEEVRAFATGTRDLIRRECRNCCYPWYELPLDAPELENQTDDPRDGEISALRSLVAALYGSGKGLEGLDPNVRRAARIVTEDWEEGPAEESEPDPVEVSAAAPYFAPLRRD